MTRADTRGAGPRVTALLLAVMLTAPYAVAMARGFVADAAERCCSNRLCCCAPGRSTAPPSCHGREAEPAPIVRCHHAPADARMPGMPALLPPAVAAVPRPDPGFAPKPPATTPRLGFGRIESRPPRTSENA